MTHQLRQLSILLRCCLVLVFVLASDYFVLHTMAAAPHYDKIIQVHIQVVHQVNLPHRGAQPIVVAGKIRYRAKGLFKGFNP